MRHDFQRVAIVNRGEPAMRFIHAAREYSLSRAHSLRTIALFTDPDRHAMFVREADEAFCLGSPESIDSETGHLKNRYVDYNWLERALSATRAEAVWVGWGFVAEHARFADLCDQLGVVFIGPSGDTMRKLGDKITSKRIAEQAGIPVASWSGGAVESVEDALRHAERIGYPLFLKATAGGGGRGIRKVYSEQEMERAFASARSEAYKSFGDPTVFLEAAMEGARHIEVQIIADHHHHVWAAGVRDCTIQRRQQKVLEEAPCSVLMAEEDRAIRAAAVCLAGSVGYHNAGTVEFLFDAQSRQFSFMEMNTRLQVEHPVTECTTGLDLVKLQIQVARGEPLIGEAPDTRGHAIEVRLNAEDPENGFAAAPGRIERLRFVTGPGVRVDTGVTEGDTIPAEFDSMIAKVIGFGGDRSEALARLRRALRDSEVVIRGGASNKPFLLDLVTRTEVTNNEVDTAWLDRLAQTGEHVARTHGPVALLQAALERYAGELALELQQFRAGAVRGRPVVRAETGRTVELRYSGRPWSVRVHKLGPSDYRAWVNGNCIDLQLEQLGEFEYWLSAAGRRYHIVSIAEPTSHRIEVDGVAHRVDSEAGGVVRSPAPAVVVSVNVEPGQMVTTGTQVAVLEAMKMEMYIKAPCSGVVTRVMTTAHVQVPSGAPLLQIEPETASTEDVAAREEHVDFSYLASPKTDSARGAACSHCLQEFKQLVLGFDVDAAQASRIQPDWDSACAFPADLQEITLKEDEILEIFVDVCALFQKQPEAEDTVVSAERRSAESYLLSYLRSFEETDLPEWFRTQLLRAVEHYGVTSLTRTDELEEALFWIAKAHARVEQQTPAIMALLERRLHVADSLIGRTDESFRVLLDRLVSVTRGLDPALSDLARELAYRLFDQPLFEQARRLGYENVETHLAALADDPFGPQRRERVRALIECAQPLEPLFAGLFPNADSLMRQLMLEVLTARYYRIRNLHDFLSVTLDGQVDLVSAEYEFNCRRIRVCAAWCDYSGFRATVAALVPCLEQVPLDEDLVLDIYVTHSSWNGDSEALQAEMVQIINEAGFQRPIRRFVAAIGGSERNPAHVEHFTWRPAVSGLEEERFCRGLHPMMAKRLNLWRFQNFHLERLPSVNSIYLFHAVARDNPKDERLLACAEVRDLTPVRDADGRTIQLPHLERQFTEALAAIRVYQSKRRINERLHWNRILLYVWPQMSCTQTEFHDIVQKLLPATEGLGLEQVVVRARIPNPETGDVRDMVVRISSQGGSHLLMTFRHAADLQPLKPLAEYDRKVVRMRQRGLVYPYEIVRMLTPATENTQAGFPPGDFLEHDLDAEGRLVPVGRPYGQNSSGIITGIICNYTQKQPDGMTRVVLLGDPSKDLGALAEPECRLIIAAFDLAEELRVPLEWFALSAGAKISMDSGVENMDWIARVLRRIVAFTQLGGEINLVIDGINVGAQPYWNAEATMLMHTRGILVMTPRAAMVLTGKRALEYSGGVSAEDNQGIGGYERIMGGNGQAQYRARDLDDACHILLRHYEHTYVIAGERFPRMASTCDPIERDVCLYPLNDAGDDVGFARIGDIFSDVANPGRKKPFEIRRVMSSVIDQDHTPLERWGGMRNAEMACVWDAHLGGYPVCLLGIESRPIPRSGFVPGDGPESWTAGTLFPQSSKKVARAINAASGNRPVVVLANLSGFDGSPESMRRLQLEYGAEIGRAVVNFDGPLVFCVISRYHGGAYVVFSRALNENMEVAALEGTYASVIGGAPAAAVVFASEVDGRARKDRRLQELTQQMETADPAERALLRAQYNNLFKVVHSEKLGEVAEEFDRIHSVQRALQVGALHRIIAPGHLRPYLIDAVRRGIERTPLPNPARSGDSLSVGAS